MATEWIQVRVRRSTMDLLRKWEVQALATGLEPGLNVAMLNSSNISHDVAIRILLGRDEHQRMLKEKARKRRKGGLDSVCTPE